MKKGTIVSIVGLGIASLAILGWLAADPPATPIPPSVQAFLTPANLAPDSFLQGAPPPGTRWVTYTAPLAYPEVVKAMKAQPGWEAADREIMRNVPETVFTPETGFPYARMDVYPGRIFIPVSNEKPPPGKFHTVIVVAERTNTLKARFVAWLDRIHGKAGPSPSDAGYDSEWSLPKTTPPKGP